MNLKAFIGVFVMALLVLAAVPGSTHAEVADPTSGNLIPNLRAKYGLERGEHITTYLIEEKPERELTWKEAYIIMQSYSLKSDYFPLNINKVKHFGRVMLEREDTKQTRVLYYGALVGAYRSKYRQTKDPSYLQKALKYKVKKIEEDPNTKAWGFPTILDRLEMHGYDVPDEAYRFNYSSIVETGTWKELKTKEDLKEIGYYNWKEEQIMPVVEQDSPMNAKIAEKLPVDRDSALGAIFNTILANYVAYGLGGLFAVAIMVFGAIRVKKRAKSRRRRRH